MTLRLARVPWSMCHFRTSRAAPARERLMATRTNATPQKEEVPKNEGPETPPDSPPLNLSDAAVKKLIRSAKKRGYVAHDQINSVLPSEEVNSEQIEGVLADETEVIEPDGRRQRNGKDESTEAEMQNEGGEIVELKRPAPAKGKSSELSARTDDPVRMYLREMGSVELLSRDGEIAIAKRIEAGREAMIAGLCESPLTFQAIIIWRDELNEGKIFLRDIIDLEATYAGPDAKNNMNPLLAAPLGPDGQPLADANGNGNGAAMPAAAAAPAHIAPPAAPPAPTPFRAAPAAQPEADKDPAAAAAESDLDDDEFENQMSLPAIDAELKPE